MDHPPKIDLNKEVPVNDLKLDLTPEQKGLYGEILAERTGTPVTDAFRRWQAQATPEQLQEFANQVNVLAAGLRVVSDLQVKGQDVVPQEAVITYDDFVKVKIVVGTVLSATRVEKSDKLLNLSVDLGEPTPRQIIAGIGKTFQPESLVGKQHAFVANLAPRTFKVGKLTLESHGMVLATGDPDKLSLIELTNPVPNGSQLG